jgi:hypothetical protein
MMIAVKRADWAYSTTGILDSLSRSLEPAPVDSSARSASLPVTLLINVSEWQM